MKERIVINQDWLVKDMKAGVPELDKLFICQKVEQVPENWEELLELCANLEKKNVFIINDGYCIEFNGLYFWKNGNVCTIEDSNNIWATKTKVTPARMWQIIKNLIGE